MNEHRSLYDDLAEVVDEYLIELSDTSNVMQVLLNLILDVARIYPPNQELFDELLGKIVEESNRCFVQRTGEVDDGFSCSA